LGEAIAFAWDGSPAAVRALTQALPLMTAARSVRIVTIGTVEDAEIASLSDHLAWHGVQAGHRHVAAVAGVKTGQQLVDEAASLGADLLVMGGYGHALWRELLLGGTTREVTKACLIPVLLSH